MLPIDIRPDKLAEEMFDYTRKLTQGMENLLNATEIDTGVSPKQAVYKPTGRAPAPSPAWCSTATTPRRASSPSRFRCW